MKRLVIMFTFLFMLFGAVEIASAEEGCAYIDREFCVPGMISNETWYTPAPDHIIGKAVWYAPYVMEATAEWRGMELDGFLGGVSLFSPEDIGEIAWLKRPNMEWEGPFLVVDASQRNHMYTTIIYVNEVVEVDFDTAERWGMVMWLDVNTNSYQINDWMIRDVEVYKGLQPPVDSIPTNYSDWFLNMVTFNNEENHLWLHADIENEIKNIADYNERNIEFLATLPIAPEVVSEIVLSESRSPLDEPENDIQRVSSVMSVEIIIPALDKSLSVALNELITNAEREEQQEVVDIGISYKDAHQYTQNKLTQMEIVPEISWNIDCEDGNAFTGFIMMTDCIPGVIAFDSWFMQIPKYTTGVATYYAPGVLEKVLENRNMSLDGYKDGIVLMSCGHIGDSVWLKRLGLGWEGPYLVIDCSQPYHMWMNLSSRHLHIEVDQDRWTDWRNSTGTQNIEMCIGSKNCVGNPVSFWYHWEKNVEYMIPKAVVSLK